MSVLDMLDQAMGAGTADQISRQLGTDPVATRKVVAGAMPVLLGAMARNTQAQSGTRSLLDALDRDHDGSVLDDVSGFIGEGNTGLGDGILGHVLGGRKRTVESSLGKASGLDAATVSRILAMLAPLIMGALGRSRRQGNLSSGGLSDALGQATQHLERQGGGALGGLASQILDRDGDGQVLDDVAELGAGMLGKLFGGSKRGR